MLKPLLYTVILCCVFNKVCLAEERSATEHFRAFGQKMVGGTWHQKLPKNVTSMHTYKWALGNQFLLVYMSHKDKPNALAVTGVDPATNLQTWWQFQDDGEIRITTVDAKAISPTSNKILLAGKDAVGSGWFEATWKNPDKLEIVPRDGAQTNGEAAVQKMWERSDDVDDLSWIDSKPPATIPKRLSLTEHFSGKKWMDGVMPDGTKFVGAGFGKWVLNGKFQIFTAATASEDQTTWSHFFIAGIDPRTSKAAAWEFTSTGATSDITYGDSGMTIVGANRRTNGDKYSFKGSFTVDGNRVHYESKIGQEGEEFKPYRWNYRNAK